MKNKTMYLISGILIAVSLVIVLVFVLLPRESTGLIRPLNYSFENVELKVGESKTDFYQISVSNALLTFSVDQEGIIEIDNEHIKGLKAGNVVVCVEINHNSQVLTEEFNVTVYQDEYHLEIDVVQGGEFKDGSLILSSSICDFNIFIYDKYDNLVVCKLNIVSSNDAEISFLFRLYRLTTESSCILTIEAEEINLIYTISVISLY
ncbi:MAG: hypothetical protein E7379_01190 [Clostridiales bacterium]|nr:hypothetical protein [Clostridiales bacterium]